MLDVGLSLLIRWKLFYINTIAFYRNLLDLKGEHLLWVTELSVTLSWLVIRPC